MLYYILIACVALLDQLVKYVVQLKLSPFQSITVWGEWVSLTYVMNQGAAFGILESQRIFLIAVAVGVFLFTWYIREELKKYPRLFQLGIAIALGGALGNLIDRIRLGFVIDFIDVHFWPVFNIADIAIVLGIILILFSIAKFSKKKSSSQSDRVMQTANRPGVEEDN